ncbi:hypothetical protein TNIN_122181, partial [Trichonephila inaurata madagascariensis]
MLCAVDPRQQLLMQLIMWYFRVLHALRIPNLHQLDDCLN